MIFNFSEIPSLCTKSHNTIRLSLIIVAMVLSLYFLFCGAILTVRKKLNEEEIKLLLILRIRWIFHKAFRQEWQLEIQTLQPK